MIHFILRKKGEIPSEHSRKGSAQGAYAYRLTGEGGMHVRRRCPGYQIGVGFNSVSRFACQIVSADLPGKGKKRGQVGIDRPGLAGVEKSQPFGPGFYHWSSGDHSRIDDDWNALMWEGGRGDGRRREKGQAAQPAQAYQHHGVDLEIPSRAIPSTDLGWVLHVGQTPHLVGRIRG